jgi:hypothetical protein
MQKGEKKRQKTSKTDQEPIKTDLKPFKIVLPILTFGPSNPIGASARAVLVSENRFFLPSGGKIGAGRFSKVYKNKGRRGTTVQGSRSKVATPVTAAIPSQRAPCASRRPR